MYKLYFLGRYKALSCRVQLNYVLTDVQCSRGMVWKEVERDVFDDEEANYQNYAPISGILNM